MFAHKIQNSKAWSAGILRMHSHRLELVFPLSTCLWSCAQFAIRSGNLACTMRHWSPEKPERIATHPGYLRPSPSPSPFPPLYLIKVPPSIQIDGERPRPSVGSFAHCNVPQLEGDWRCNPHDAPGLVGTQAPRAWAHHHPNESASRPTTTDGTPAARTLLLTERSRSCFSGSPCSRHRAKDRASGGSSWIASD